MKNDAKTNTYEPTTAQINNCKRFLTKLEKLEKYEQKQKVTRQTTYRPQYQLG